MNSLFNPDYECCDLPFSKILNVGPVPGGDSFLLINDDISILFDAGFACGGELLVQQIENELKGRSLNYILLSHSHYDHAPGSAWCINKWPNCKVIGSIKTKEVFQRPGALSIMRQMDSKASQKFGIHSNNDYFDKLRVDMPLEDKTSICLGNLTIIMQYFPGHTNCSAGYYFPDYNFLLSSETLGIYCGGDQIPFAYLTGFQKGINSIERAQKLAINHILIPHTGLLHGADCTKFLNKTKECVYMVRDTIINKHFDGYSKKELIQVLKNLTYTPYLEAIQPYEAFELNAKYIIECILNEYCN